MEKEKEIPAKKKGLSSKTLFYIIILCLMILIPTGVYVFDLFKISNLKDKHKTELYDVRMNAGNTVKSINQKNLESLTRVFSWTVRSEMLHNNIGQVNSYMTELVKTADLQDISIIKTDGIVVLSTNKKYEGNVYAGPVASQLSSINEVVTQTGKDAVLICICPLMGLDNRMGTIVITYQPTVYTFGNTE